MLTVNDERFKKSFLHGEAEETVGGVGSVYPVGPELDDIPAMLLREHPAPQPVSGLQHPDTQSGLHQLRSSRQTDRQTSALCSALGSTW